MWYAAAQRWAEFRHRTLWRARHAAAKSLSPVDPSPADSTDLRSAGRRLVLRHDHFAWRISGEMMLPDHPVGALELAGVARSVEQPAAQALRRQLVADGLHL